MKYQYKDISVHFHTIYHSKPVSIYNFRVVTPHIWISLGIMIVVIWDIFHCKSQSTLPPAGSCYLSQLTRIYQLFKWRPRGSLYWTNGPKRSHCRFPDLTPLDFVEFIKEYYLLGSTNNFARFNRNGPNKLFWERLQNEKHYILIRMDYILNTYWTSNLVNTFNSSLIDDLRFILLFVFLIIIIALFL